MCRGRRNRRLGNGSATILEVIAKCIDSQTNATFSHDVEDGGVFGVENCAAKFVSSWNYNQSVGKRGMYPDEGVVCCCQICKTWG
jgi:hypothetical protein